MLDIFQKALNRLRDECLVTGYELLLEADVVGWLFHILLTEPGVEPKDVHLSARLSEAQGFFFDIAVGAIESASGKRPAVSARLAVEVKLFPRIGFTDQQHREHFDKVINKDLPKLGSIRDSAEVRASLLVDAAGYLNGRYAGENRKEVVIRTRDKVAPGAHVFIVQLQDNQWEVEHTPPPPAK